MLTSPILQVKECSGAEVCWPSQLKIGAKTKKGYIDLQEQMSSLTFIPLDPFVKVIGTIEQIEKAKKYIVSTLQVKVADTIFSFVVSVEIHVLITRKVWVQKERATLKMDIHHSIHSHIIGKAGRGIQQVMRTTGCHIHFPDSNKYT